MFKVKITVIAILVGGILLGALSYLTPTPHLTDAIRTIVDEDTYHSTLAYLVMSTTYGVGGGLLFLLGLDGFTKAFRRVYYCICAGFIVQGLGSLYYVYASFTGTVKSDGYSLIAEIPLMLGMVIVYIGFVQYARLLRINNLLAKPLVVATGFVILMAVVWFLPHRTDTGVHNEFLFDLAHALQAVELFMYLVAPLVAGEIRSIAAPLYRRSLTWLRWAQLSAFPATLVLFSGDYLKLPGWLSADAMSLLFMLSNIFGICSAYAFNKIARLAAAQQTYNNSLLDSVIFLGSLASNVSEVDPILDRVREITAGRAGDSPLTPSEKRVLQDVYKELEEYLIAKEQVRAFDRKSLAEIVQERFNWTPGTAA